MNAVSLKPDELLDFLLAVAPVRPVFIKGAPGGGKSTIVRHFCDSVGMDCVTLHGSTCLPEDVIGLPIPDHETGKTRYYPPEKLAREEPYCLFLDEFPNSSREVQKAFYSLVLDKRTDSFEMPQGSIVILSGNRQEDQAFVNPVSSALINRVVCVELMDDPAGFLRWAEGESLHPLVIDYLKIRPDHMRGRADSSGSSFSSQRAWHILSDGLKALGDDAPENLIKAISYGTLTPAHATAFAAFARMRFNRNSIHALLKGNTRWPSEPNERDILIFMADALRLHLVRELPKDNAAIDETARQLAHRAKGLIRDLAQISMEIAQTAVATPDNGEPLPAWFMAEIVRDLPRLAQQGK